MKIADGACLKIHVSALCFSNILQYQLTSWTLLVKQFPTKNMKFLVFTLYLERRQLLEIWFEIINDPSSWSLQSDSAYKKDDQNDVRKHGRYVRDLRKDNGRRQYSCYRNCIDSTLNQGTYEHPWSTLLKIQLVLIKPLLKLGSRWAITWLSLMWM